MFINSWEIRPCQVSLLRLYHIETGLNATLQALPGLVSRGRGAPGTTFLRRRLALVSYLYHMADTRYDKYTPDI